MSELATIYTGRPVLVCEKSMPEWGHAFYSGCFTIALCGTMPRSEIAFTFLHEVGHIVKGHIPDHYIDPAGQVGQLDVAPYKADPGGEYMERMRARIDRTEKEADDWAAATMRTLRATHPDIDKLLIG